MDDNNWDLQAVVRGCGGVPAAAAAAMERVDPFFVPSSSYSPSFEIDDGCFGAGLAPEDDFLFCFPDLFTSQTSLHELEDLCKPFFPKHLQQEQQLPMSSQEVPPLLPGLGARRLQRGLFPQQPRHQQPLQRPFPHTTPKSKRRKNQQKRVVCQVPADGLSSDVWAWRKYGQKPIKGSPYPRGYYRCSSSKGCLARKQVERSRTDPGMFVITYTAEHNHPVPTHRNSLAGSTRNKFSSSSSSQKVNSTSAGADGGGGGKGGGGGEPKCDDVPADNKPATSPLSSPAAGEAADDELHLPLELEEEDDDDEEMLLVSDMDMLGEDDMLFVGVEEKVDNDHFLEADTTDLLSTSSWVTNNVS